MDQDQQLLDGIYEAAVVPDLWPSVLDSLAKLANAVGAELLTSDSSNLRWIGNPEGTRIVHEWLAEGWCQRNSRMPRLLALNYAGFIRGEDHFSPDELATNPEFVEFFYPRGLGIGGGTAIPLPTGDFLVFSLEVKRDAGPITRGSISRLDTLRPHLARAGLVSARLQLERAKALAQALQIIGLPAAVLRESGRMLASNDHFASMVPAVFQDRTERLFLTERAPDALLKAALAGLSRAGLPNVNSIPLPASEGRPPVVIHVLPVRGMAHDIFERGFALVVATPVERKKVPNAAVLQGLFDLTPAEAAVAQAIGDGKTVELIAKAHEVSRETVRTQLKSVLTKTGLQRQVDLAALLSGVTFSPP